ncbi:histidine kinase [Chitinophaga qingshengii]|uniref:Histidine kinase n=1 Tax=Chitinophaga qingshengii TaxID=1569794 RepID=A0ABR7TL96_9BACT|nr:histidine kinase [Chitinophaga qingshengii]MBC9929829.1 histidine kinase [Chitinophaga qingshengii]
MRHNKPYRYFTHLVVWMALILLYAYPAIKANWQGPMALKYVLVRQVLYGCINFQLFFLLAFVWLPAPVARRQYRRVVVISLLTVCGFALMKYFIGYVFFPDQVLIKMFAMVGYKNTYMSFPYYFLTATRTGLGVALLAYSYRLLLQRQQTGPQDRQLATAAEAARERYVRMQENSRLLLHHLQQLTPILEDERKRDQEGVKAILLLSDLLRYMLYDKALEKDTVGLPKELLYFERYIALRSLCHSDQPLTFSASGDTQQGTLAALQLQHTTETALQQLHSGPVAVRVQVKPGRLLLSLQQHAAPEQHYQFKIYPDHA